MTSNRVQGKDSATPGSWLAEMRALEFVLTHWRQRTIAGQFTAGSALALFFCCVLNWPVTRLALIVVTNAVIAVAAIGLRWLDQRTLKRVPRPPDSSP